MTRKPAPYREEKGGTFEADGVKYDLNYILAHVEQEPIQQIAVSKLIWVLADSEPLDAERVAKADLESPILVTRYINQELTVDGAHRLTKAVQHHRQYLPYRRVSHKVLQESMIKPKWVHW